MSRRLTKIYTRSGDDGTTGLVGGERLSKADARIEAYGTVDELNSVIGIARGLNSQRPAADPGQAEVEEWLREIQNQLFVVGSELACHPDTMPAQMKVVTGEMVDALEQRMDRMNEELGPLEEFILPGGGLLGAHLHLARTVCRRAERHVVALEVRDSSDPRCRRYLNRLSDFLFVLARWCARATGSPEHLWDREN